MSSSQYLRSISLVSILLCLISGVSYAVLFDKSKKQTISQARAEARESGFATLGAGPQRKNFRFADVSLWLNNDGDWQIEGKIPHRGLQCATYELGVRFGAGDPGCTNVEWLMEEQYVTTQQQCNNSVVQHTGGDLGSFIKTDYARVSCAERYIRCRGVCN